MTQRALKSLNAATARHWAPFVRGPKEQELKCQGAFWAKLIAWLHFSWPFARGIWRFTWLLRKATSLRRHLNGVRFVSSCGVPIILDIGSDEFLHLSGRLSSEPLELAIITRLIREGDIFVDVGAHCGLYILHVLGRLGDRGSYLAIEPSPSNFRFLLQAFPGADPRLQRLETAITDKDGQSFLRNEGSTEAYLDGDDQSATRVHTCRLDTLLAGRDLRQRTLIVKLDTEGNEASAIRGCQGLASAKVRPIFLIEFLPRILGQTREQIIDAFTATFGDCYRFLAIDAKAGRLIEFRMPLAIDGDVRNILATPPHAMDRLSTLFDDESRHTVDP